MNALLDSPRKLSSAPADIRRGNRRSEYPENIEGAVGPKLDYLDERVRFVHSIEDSSENLNLHREIECSLNRNLRHNAVTRASGIQGSGDAAWYFSQSGLGSHRILPVQAQWRLLPSMVAPNSVGLAGSSSAANAVRQSVFGGMVGRSEITGVRSTSFLPRATHAPHAENNFPILR